MQDSQILCGRHWSQLFMILSQDYKAPRQPLTRLQYFLVQHITTAGQDHTVGLAWIKAGIADKDLEGSHIVQVMKESHLGSYNQRLQTLAVCVSTIQLLTT